ncbi:MAG: cell division protein FtsI [Lachnospiraceae bacterium]|nr:cell division protein FtsI [Lachnospiraceae bacterium]
MSNKRQVALKSQRFTDKMQKKLAVSFFVILAAFIGLSVRLYAINRDKGEQYKRQVLSQQSYDSVVLPAKRGEIIDSNGTKIAVSEKVYNICIDAKTLNSDGGIYLEPVIQKLFSFSDISYTYTQPELRAYIKENPASRYRIIAKKQRYEAISPLMDELNGNVENSVIKGVWLEETYQRTYPYKNLAADVIGFVQGDNEGAYGLEEYYNDILVGTNGRQYGYLNDDENLERTTKPAENGYSLITSLDVNIQSIVEKHIQAFNLEHQNEYREGDGASNIGVIIMNPNNGEIYAMASSPGFDLSDPRNTDNMKIEVSDDFAMPGLSIDNGDAQSTETPTDDGAENVSTENVPDTSATVNEPVVSVGQIKTITAPAGTGLPDEEEDDASGNKILTYEEAYEKAKMEALNKRWKNFCINFTYEPGSTMKPFTMACGLESGELTGNENFVCNGVKEVGDHKIHCNNRLGHGPLTFSQALEKSCNVAFMDMGSMIGKQMFMKYNRLFNFGLKTNIDLTGEALTNSLVFDTNTMTPTDLAIASFGQGFNVTMIQMAAGFCSLINGGYYYQPHIVTRIINDGGATVRNVEPRVLKQTVSAETSEKLVELCNNVVSEGTGKTARPAGYRIGGKTGTAEKYPRGTENYIVSFIGFAPSDDPQIVIYTVIDEPNVDYQPNARYATVLTRDILTEVLPYMHVFKTEEMSEEEIAELEEKQLTFAISSDDLTGGDEAETGETDENGNPLPESGEAGQEAESVITILEEPEEEVEMPEIKIDEETGYAIDPTTGVLLDPQTGAPIDGHTSDLE